MPFQLKTSRSIIKKYPPTKRDRLTTKDYFIGVRWFGCMLYTV